jgi:hypothetical protein
MEHWREEPASGWRERWCTGEVWAPAISLLPSGERDRGEGEKRRSWRSGAVVGGGQWIQIWAWAVSNCIKLIYLVSFTV